MDRNKSSRHVRRAAFGSEFRDNKRTKTILKNGQIERTTMKTKTVKIASNDLSKKKSSKISSKSIAGAALSMANHMRANSIQSLDRKVKDFQLNRKRNQIILSEVNFLYDALNKMKNAGVDTTEGMYPIYEKEMMGISSYIVSEYPRTHKEKVINKNITYRNSLTTNRDDNLIKKMQEAAKLYEEEQKRKAEAKKNKKITTGKRVSKSSSKSSSESESISITNSKSGSMSKSSKRKRTSSVNFIEKKASNSNLNHLNQEEEKVKDSNDQIKGIMKKMSLSSEFSIPQNENVNETNVKDLMKDLNCKTGDIANILVNNSSGADKKENHVKKNSFRKSNGVYSSTSQKVL